MRTFTQHLKCDRCGHMEDDDTGFAKSEDWLELYEGYAGQQTDLCPECKISFEQWKDQIRVERVKSDLGVA